MNGMAKHLLVKATGDLNEIGSIVRFLGRTFKRAALGIQIYDEPEYYLNILKEHKMLECNTASTPAPSQIPITDDMENLIDEERNSLYRRTVGKLQWNNSIRPDWIPAVKELARFLNNPTECMWRLLKHLLRYIKGTLHMVMFLSPQISIQGGTPTDFTLCIYVDANWAGCRLTRKSTSGMILEFMGAPVASQGWTQSVRALSSAESELYGIGSGTAEGLHIRSFLNGVNFGEVSFICSLYTH